MFLTAPVGSGIRLRAFPVATLLLVAALIATAVVTLPAATRLAPLRGEVESTLASADVDHADVRSMPWRIESVRRAALASRAEALRAGDPIEHWGLRSNSAPWHAASALFLHADLVHLVTNLIGLLLLGMMVEQAWGPIATLVLALAGGAAALWIDAQAGPEGTLIGSSAAAAVLFGACSVLYRSRPVQFGYVYLEFLRPLRGRFELPLLGLAGIWLALQGIGIASAASSGEHDVAYVSHLAGFAIGALAALILPRRDAATA